MTAILETILAATRLQVAERKQKEDVGELERRAARHRPRGFGRALRNARPPAIIAELKKASPSKGIIRADLDVPALSQGLAAAGAGALSVLTNEEFFQGSLDNLRQASAAASLPCLRKDFILDEFQLLEARANCADAVLLIAAALEESQLRRLHMQARALGLDVLTEVHNEMELRCVLDMGCEIVGINSRDLRTFHVDQTAQVRLASQLPPSVLRVAESGIGSGRDIQVLREAGYDAFLVGESLMRAVDPVAALRNLLASVRPSEATVRVAEPGKA
jgi:indole-3-glycerol phosphate synthase